MRTPTSLLAVALAALLAGCSTLPGWMILQGRSAITDYRHFHNVEIAPAARPLPVPPATSAIHLPAAPEGQSFEQLLERNGTVAFIVLKDGQLLYERYFNGYGRESITTSFSMAKSVVALLLGLLIEEGRIGSVNDPITRYIPELAQRDPRFAKVTLKHLLEMRSGIAFLEEYKTPWSQAARFYLTPDLQGEVRQMWIETEPDTRFHYSSGDTQLLGLALERAAGQPLARLLEQRIWQPMGAEFGASWSQDSAEGGTTKAFCCLNARALDFARLGQLMLQGGRAEGRTVVPERWIREVLAVREHPGVDAATRGNLQLAGTPRAAFYTWQWRHPALPAAGSALGAVPSDDFYAQGLHGQVLYVAPRQRMVLLRLGTDYGQAGWWPSWMARIAELNE